MYYLLDIERMILTGKTWYWKQNRHGYTQFLSQAGLFEENEAKNIVASDCDHRTVMVSDDVVEKILIQ